MLFLAIVATLGAIGWNFFVVFANGKASSPQEFKGSASIVAIWCLAAALWVAWVIG